MIRRGLGTLALFVGAALIAASPAVAAVDPLRSQQWALDRIDADQAWAKSRGTGVSIAIVDTGIDLDHPDLTGQIAANYTCMDGPCRQGGGDDDNGHGTHVAGIAAAVTANGRGISGVAPDARLIAVKAFDSEGRATCEDATEAIIFAADKGAKVINLSFGSEIDLVLLGVPLPSCVDALEEAAAHASNKGAVIAIASGNTSLPASFYASPALEVVGATGPDDRVASYSSTGEVDVFAPGGDANGACDAADCVVSTFKGGEYTSMQGTSMATPHVAGVAALLLARGYSNTETVARINSTADTTPDGEKRLNASRAVGAGSSTGGGGSGTSQSPKPKTGGGGGTSSGGSPTGAPSAATPRASASPPPEVPTLASPSVQAAPAAKEDGDRGGGIPPGAFVGLGAAIVMTVVWRGLARGRLRR